MKKIEVLYKKVKEEIKEKIEKKIFKVGDKIPSIRDLCKEFNVSNITIKQAISELIREGYIETRGSKGTYVKSNKNNTKLVATIFQANIKNPFIGEIYSGIEKILSIENYHILFLSTDGNIEKETRYLKEILERGVDGVIISTVISDLNSPSVYLLEEFKKKNIPVIFIDIKIDGLDFDYVETDNFEAGYEATKYFIEKGHRKIGIILSRNVNTVKERLEGYRNALRDYGIEFNQLYIKGGMHNLTHEEIGYICGLELLNLKDPPTAIFCTSDSIAIGVYKACYEMNLKIPKDVSIIGFDNLNFTEYLIPSLTTVHQEKFKIGEEAAKILMLRIKGDDSPPKNIILKHKIIERESVSESKYKKRRIENKTKIGKVKL